MIKFSRREDYAIILLNKLAENYKKRLVPLSEVSKEYSISVLFLRNLAHTLRKKKIVGAVEGKRGGYYLLKEPKLLTVGEVLTSFSQKPMLECCSLPSAKHAKGTCPKASYCAPGFMWRKLHKEFIEKLYNLSLSDFAQQKV